MNDIPARRILVIDDRRTMRFAATYARSAAAGLAALSSGPWDEVWLDHDLGPGPDIRAVVREIERRVYADAPFEIGHIFVHTSNPAGRRR